MVVDQRPCLFRISPKTARDYPILRCHDPSTARRALFEEIIQGHGDQRVDALQGAALGAGFSGSGWQATQKTSANSNCQARFSVTAMLPRSPRWRG